MAKEITVLVKFRGTVPEDVSIADIEEQIDCSLENSLRLNFSDSKEEDDDLREPWIEREDMYITEKGFQLLIGQYNQDGTGSNQFRPVLRIVQQAALYRRPGRIQEKHCAAVHVEPDGQSEGNDSQGV